METESPGGCDGFERPIRRRDRLIALDGKLTRAKRKQSSQTPFTLAALHADELYPKDWRRLSVNERRALTVARPGLIRKRRQSESPIVDGVSSPEVVRRDIEFAQSYLRHYRSIIGVLAVIDTFTAHRLTRDDARDALRRGQQDQRLRERVAYALRDTREPRRTVTVGDLELSYVGPPSMSYPDLARFLKRDRKAMERLIAEWS
jgi:hypothetical protein